MCESFCQVLLPGYITVNLTSAQLGHPALVGLAPGQLPGLGESSLTAKATFAFDSRTNMFAMSAEIRYEDECVLVVLWAAGSNTCGAGQVMTVMAGRCDIKRVEISVESAWCLQSAINARN
jgi:hypothetical protein